MRIIKARHLKSRLKQTHHTDMYGRVVVRKQEAVNNDLHTDGLQEVRGI